MKNKLRVIIFAVLIAISMTSLSYAQEKRTVAGRYKFVVGFLGEMNGVDLSVSKNGKLLEGLEKMLQVTVMKGNKGKILILKRKYNQPGRYAGYFIPTETGTYLFLIQGLIDGTPINELFESNFHDGEDFELLPFP